MRFAVFAIVALLLAFGEAKERNNKPYKVVCYFESWKDYSHGDDHITPELINPQVCTHMIYAFTLLKDHTIHNKDNTIDNSANHGHNLIRRTVDLRVLNPNLTVMVSIGGYDDGSTKYSEMAKTPETRKQFIDSVVAFLQKYDFDGLDLMWEYPGYTGVGGGERKDGNPDDKQNYILLLQELKEAFKPHEYVLSVAVSNAKYQIDHAYNIPEVSKTVDFINFLTYYYHGSWDGKTGHDSPLVAGSEQDPTKSVQYTVDYWIKQGADSKKLVLGIPLYGVGFKLTDPTEADVGARAHGGAGGSQAKLCQDFKQPGWKVNYDAVAQAPYAVNADHWVSFQNAQSIQKRMEFIVEKKLGGSMVYAVGGDDALGKCGQGKFPLMKLQMKVLNKVEVTDPKTYEKAANGKWTIVWQDEFNGQELNLTEWKFEVGTAENGWGNGELEYYTKNRHENVRVANGHLVIEARAEQYETRNFTSARINSHSAHVYGKFEARARLPLGYQLWPAIWLMPKEPSKYGWWANSGEIDIMEARGEKPHEIMGTIHWGGHPPNNTMAGSGALHFAQDFTKEFHNFAIEWDPYSFKWSVDDKVYHSENIHRIMHGRGKDIYTDYGQPFDQPFYWILNVAVGGPGFFNHAPAVTPQKAKETWTKPTMEIDYVRVYQWK